MDKKQYFEKKELIIKTDCCKRCTVGDYEDIFYYDVPRSKLKTIKLVCWKCGKTIAIIKKRKK